MKIVYVKWLDAVGSAGGWSHDITLRSVEGDVETIGFLLDENDKFILVAGHHAQDQVQGEVAIPWSMITEFYEVVWT